MSELTVIKLKPGGNGRYKVEIYPRIWFYSDKPSWWQRTWFGISGRPVVKLPDIDKCDHEYVNKKREHHSTGEMIRYKECSVCEHEVDYYE